MLAPNPNTRRPPKREPWETPHDMAPAEHRAYAHRIALELATDEIRQAMDAAARIFADRRRPAIWCNDVPFATVAEAVDWIHELGASPHKRTTTWQAINRAAESGVERYGFRWKHRADQPDGVRAGFGHPVPIVRLSDGRRYAEIRLAAEELAAAHGITPHAARERIRKAMARDTSAFGSKWQRAEQPAAL